MKRFSESLYMMIQRFDLLE